MRTDLPQTFLQELGALEASYLKETDPIRQSGFSGGAKRWRAEREPILDAVESDGDLLDIGCANGYLLECLLRWGRERGLNLTPHGLDQGAQLVELARQRLSGYEGNIHTGNAWGWRPPRKYKYVYMLCDCVPPSYLAECVRSLLDCVVEPAGRLIIGSYGSRSDGIRPMDVAAFFESVGLQATGEARGGSPPVTAFAWVDA